MKKVLAISTITLLIVTGFLFTSCQRAKEGEGKKEAQAQKEVKQQPSESKSSETKIEDQPKPETEKEKPSEVKPSQQTEREQKEAVEKVKEPVNEQKPEEQKETKAKEEFIKDLKKYRIAYIADGDVWVMRGDGSEKKKVTNKGDVTVLFGWSYDDTRILFGTGKLEPPPGMDAESYAAGYNLWIVNLETSGEQKFKDIETIGARWVPRKEEIVFLAKDESLWVVNSDGKKSKEIIKCCASPEGFSPDGNEIAYVDIGYEEKNEEIDIKWSNIWIKNIVTNESRQITHKGSNSTPRWFPDGKKILFRSDINFMSEKDWKSSLWMINLDGNNPIELMYPKFPIAADMIFPDGKHFVITSPIDGTTAIANIETGMVKDIIFDGKHGRKAIISPDGSYLIYVSQNNEIRIINIEGNILLKIGIGDQPIWSNKRIEK